MCFLFWFKRQNKMIKQLLLWFPQKPREIKHILIWLLKSWAINEALEITYAKRFSLSDQNIVKQQQKLMLLSYDERNEKKCHSLLKKSFSDYESYVVNFSLTTLMS